MVRLLFLLAVVVVLVLLVRKVMAFASAQRRGPEEAAEDATDAPASGTDAKLVRCVECGAFVPKTDALPVPTGYRCGGGGCAKPG
jgi:hypothetical protein